VLFATFVVNLLPTGTKPSIVSRETIVDVLVLLFLYLLLFCGGARLFPCGTGFRANR